MQVNLAIEEVGRRLSSGLLQGIKAVPACDAAAHEAAFRGVPLLPDDKAPVVRNRHRTCCSSKNAMQRLARCLLWLARPRTNGSCGCCTSVRCTASHQSPIFMHIAQCAKCNVASHSVEVARHAWWCWCYWQQVHDVCSSGIYVP